MKKVTLEGALEWVGEYSKPERFADIRRHLDPAWIEQALDATGTATLRKRRLPADQVVWLVIGMALYRDRPIYDLVDQLDLVLPGRATGMAPSAVVEARARLGADPLEWLFERTARKWAHESARKHAWRGLALYGVDGSTLRVADSPENRAHFGGPSGPRGESGYPLVRIATLMALRSHLMASVGIGPYEDSEIVLASSLWGEVPDDSLTIVDRGFLAAGILVPLNRDGKNRQWLTRTKSTTRYRVLQHLGKNDDLVEFDVSSQARANDSSLPLTFTARVVRYEKKGFKPQALVTSLTDHKAFPASDMIAVYHERWELELGYDEIKTEMLNREETIRCKSVAGVEQELWGIFLAYNLVRLEMERTADSIGVEPIRISFVGALRLICEEWWWASGASPGAIPKNLARLRSRVARLVLPPRRSHRSFPRAVKVKMSNYLKKRPSSARA
jgi:Insertion element 4 transposase N-terminal/Transposase DDE domain